MSNEARKMLGRLLGRHHRVMVINGVNCSACHNYLPTVDDVRAALAHERSAGAAPLDVETLGQAMENTCDSLSQWTLSPSDARMLAAEYARLLDATPSPSAENPTVAYMDYIQSVHDAGRKSDR